MLSNTHKTAGEFTGVRRKIRIVKFVVDRLIPIEPEERADVWCNTDETLKWYTPIKYRGSSMVEEEVHIEKGKEPCTDR